MSSFSGTPIHSDSLVTDTHHPSGVMCRSPGASALILPPTCTERLS